MQPPDLLQKYNPLLVLLPQDTTRHRPGSKWHQQVSKARGDYHPCAVETFLSLVVQKDRPRPWNPLRFTEAAIAEPTGLDALKSRAQAAGEPATLAWELDVAPLPSQDPDKAWQAYGNLLASRGGDFTPRVYGRYVGGPQPCLVYWYLYLYNDAPNKHEGDWEMVALQLDGDGTPFQAGYAGHSSGFRRPWQRVQLLDGRPLVYVARGSHAAYFDHKALGHRANSLRMSKGWPEPLDSIWSSAARLVMDGLEVLRLVDHTPALPGTPGEEIETGVIVDPELVVLPEDDPVSRPQAFWWMGLRGLWGSRHARLNGFIGPSPPWLQLQKWRNPAAWIDGCVAD